MTIKPAITVLVLSYNSEATIIDTLISILGQTYESIEIVVSDDMSRDNTVSLANAFLLKNSGINIKRYQVVQSENWGGTVKNIKNGVQYVRTKWVKLIAADDLLLENCLTCYMERLAVIDCDILLSDLGVVNELVMSNKYLKSSAYLIPTFLSMSNEFQEDFIKIKNILPMSTIFLKTDVAIQMFNKIDLVLLEDWPFWVEVIRSKLIISYVSNKLVNYRIHLNQISRDEKHPKALIFSEDLREFRNKYQKNYNLKIVFVIDYLLSFLFNFNKRKIGLFYYSILLFNNYLRNLFNLK
jgi:glycosyltransferase involved in cell wall biosynthesis